MRETAREQDTKGPFLPWRWHGQQFRRVGGQCKRCSNGRMRPNPLAPIALPAPEASANMAGRSFYLAWLACHRCCWNTRVHSTVASCCGVGRITVSRIALSALDAAYLRQKGLHGSGTLQARRSERQRGRQRAPQGATWNLP